MSRCSPDDVRDVIKVLDGTDPASHIRAASAIVDVIEDQDTSSLLNAELLQQIETYLAAHLYQIKYPQVRSQSIGRASEQYIRAEAGTGFSSSDWGQHAIALDRTGTLNSMDQDSGTVPEIAWLGLRSQEQTPDHERNTGLTW